MDKLGILIFDMDGTLVDSMKQHADAFSQILSEEYEVPLDFGRQEYLNTAGQPLDEQFNHVLRLAKGIQATNMAELLDRFWVLVQKSKPVLFPDVSPAIKQLRQAGYTLIVISGCAPFVVEAKMRKAGISCYFRLMLGTDKNVPDMIKGEGHFKIVRRELRLTHEQFRANSALIGDAKHDMMLAKEAGIMAVGRVTRNNGNSLKRAGADFLVHDLKEFVFLLQNGSTDIVTFLPVSELKERSR
jgi:phosphoglycolate phosphatase-like HAD superfamily hydrolase